MAPEGELDMERELLDALAREFLKANGGDPETRHPTGQANDLALLIYLKAHEGETWGLDECSECGEFTVGDHRCSCGNRRVGFDYDGDFRDLGTVWATAY